MTPEQRAAAMGDVRARKSARAFNPWTLFFAGTSALLLVLLVARSSAFRRKRALPTG